MSKIEEARTFLKELQVPVKQQSDICCLTLLAMANVKENDSWENATNNWIRIHDVIAYIKKIMILNTQKTVEKLFVNKQCTILEMLHLSKIMEKLQTARITAIV